MLFRNGQNRTVAAFNAEKETEAGLTSVKTIDEAAFAVAVAGDLRNMTYLLEYGWLGLSTPTSHQEQLANAMWVINGTRYHGLSAKNIPYRDFLRYATTEQGWFPTWHEALQNIFDGGCGNICNEVAEQKLGQAYRVATGLVHLKMQQTTLSLLIASVLSKIIRTISTLLRTLCMVFVVQRTSQLQ